MSDLTLESQIRRACRAEVLHAKPGNVTPDVSFHDASVDDFLHSADLIAPVLARTPEIGVGEAVLQSIQLTNREIGHNTNLGIVLLIAPLAAVPEGVTLDVGIEVVLQSLTVEDAALVYEAIALASPGGLGKSSQQDVAERPTQTLRGCMELAADRDLIAAQYANGFQQVLGDGLELLLRTNSWPGHDAARIGWVAINLLERFGDSLITRKNGPELGRKVSAGASAVLKSGWPFASEASSAYEDFDQWLRGDGNRRNPGTTADLIAATLFAAQREGICRVADADGAIIFEIDSC